MGVRIGDRGVADTDLRPSGFVTVGGERRDARTAHATIPAGTPVTVVGGDAGGLVVQPAAGLAESPLHGTPVLASFGERVDAEVARTQAAQAEWLGRHRQTGFRVSVAAGALSAAAASAWRWDDLPTDTPLAVAVSLVAAGGLLGWVAFRTLDGWVGEVDSGVRRVTPAAAGLGVVGAFAVAAGCLPFAGVPVALAAGAVAGGVAAAIPIGLVLAVGEG
jgi:hypothetical protein